MTAQLGQFALILALAASLAQAGLLLAGERRGEAAWLAAGRHACVASAVLVVSTFALLVAAFVVDDVSLQAVAARSDPALPVAYRAAAAWSSPEGSMLLGAACVALWALALALRLAPGRVADGLHGRALAILGLVAAGFLAALCATANPFARPVAGVAQERGLDPLLQDPALLLHLPLLVAGGTGLAVAFALAVAAASDDRLDEAWAEYSRAWALRAWLLLSAGIGVGSAWADREPAWGGWWPWEPFHAVTLVSWLAATALLHSLALTGQRGLFRRWTAFLAILAFPLVLLGGWIVRSAPGGAMYGNPAEPGPAAAFLVLAAVAAGAAAAALLRRHAEAGPEGPFEMISREAVLVANGMLLLGVLAAVLLGLLQPHLAAMLGPARGSVGASYFNSVFVPLVIPALALMGPGSRLRWSTESAGEAMHDALRPAAAGVAAAVAAAWLAGRTSAWMVVGLFLSAWIAWHGLEAIVQRWRRGRPEGAPRPAAFYAMHAAHLGVALLVAGATLSSGLEQSAEVAAVPGTAESVGYLRVRVEGASRTEGANYRAIRLRVAVLEGDRARVVEPELRYYRAGGLPTPKSAILRGLGRDVHVSFAGPAGGGAWRLHVRLRPFMSLAWAGMGLIAAGGLLALAGRRRRTPSRERGGRPGAALGLALGKRP